MQGPTLDDLARSLNWRLEAKGLKPVEENSLIHPYDELTRKMLANSMNELTAKSLLELCVERTSVRTKQDGKHDSLGFRVFLRWDEDGKPDSVHVFVCRIIRRRGASIPVTGIPITIL
jgi:hypothetical protein